MFLLLHLLLLGAVIGVFYMLLVTLLSPHPVSSSYLVYLPFLTTFSPPVRVLLRATSTPSSRHVERLG